MGMSKEHFTQLQDEFANRVAMVEEGYLSPLDAALEFRKEQEMFEELIKSRKDWCNTFSTQIANEASDYGSDGYKGYKFESRVNTRYDFNDLEEWMELNKKLKDYEAMCKENYNNPRYNGEEKPKVIHSDRHLRISKIKGYGKDRQE